MAVDHPDAGYLASNGELLLLASPDTLPKKRHLADDLREEILLYRSQIWVGHPGQRHHRALGAKKRHATYLGIARRAQSWHK